MVFHPNYTPTTDRMREIVESQAQDFPYTAMDSDLAIYPDRCTPWHWHEYFEFGIVREGCLRLHTRQGAHIVEAGGGYFINANVLHENRTARADAGARLYAQLFDRSLIASSGLAVRRYVAPVENCVDLEAMIFSPKDAQGRRVLAALERAFAAAESDDLCHELRVCAGLNEAWALLYEMAAERIRASAGRDREESARIKAMLSFIHENYARELSVAEIAAAAGVCERECFRSFAGTLDTTPVAYLTRYRVDMAARALAETGGSVAQIAEDCGFSNASYFGRVFRQLMGCTPGAYRRSALEGA